MPLSRRDVTRRRSKEDASAHSRARTRETGENCRAGRGIRSRLVGRWSDAARKSAQERLSYVLSDLYRIRRSLNISEIRHVEFRHPMRPVVRGRPHPGTLTGRVWEIADEITREKGRRAERREVIERYVSREWQPEHGWYPVSVLEEVPPRTTECLGSRIIRNTSRGRNRSH